MTAVQEPDALLVAIATDGPITTELTGTAFWAGPALISLANAQTTKRATVTLALVSNKGPAKGTVIWLYHINAGGALFPYPTKAMDKMAKHLAEDLKWAAKHAQ